MDPVGRNWKGLIKLNNFYNKLNFTNVHYKLYQNARQELHKEIYREQFFFDI